MWYSTVDFTGSVWFENNSAIDLSGGEVLLDLSTVQVLILCVKRLGEALWISFEVLQPGT